jgi:hypothetical protein
MICFLGWKTILCCLVPTAVSLALMATSRSDRSRRIWLFFYCLCVVATAACSLPLVWVLRHGLGPDSGPASHGLRAIQECVGIGADVILLIVFLACLGHVLNQWALDRKAGVSREMLRLKYATLAVQGMLILTTVFMAMLLIVPRQTTPMIVHTQFPQMLYLAQNVAMLVFFAFHARQQQLNGSSIPQERRQK